MIDLHKFCARNNRRLPFNRPWTKDGKRYATDGVVLIRLHATELPDDVPDGRVPNADAVLTPVEGDFKPWPCVDCCYECDGKGVNSCESCHGSGMCTGCACGAEHECGACEGGMTLCERCRVDTTIDLGGVRVAQHYAYLISTLPNVSYLAAGPGDPVRLRFDGGDGAVMPIRKDEEVPVSKAGAK